MDVLHRFDPSDATVVRHDGEAIVLRPQAATLLAFLSARMGEVVSKDALMDAVWPDTAVTENSLYQAIAEIRKGLGEDGDKILQTVPRKGYRLVAPDAAVPESPPIRRRGLLAGLAAALVALAVAVWVFLPRGAAVAAAPSIVILPFEAADDDPRWTRIGRGLSAEIAGELARNDWLHVIAPHSAQTLAGQDAPSAADSFGVRFVMTGGVQVSGDTLRINAALHDAETDRVVWSERWQRPQAEIFDVQDEILTRIGASLAPSFTVGVLARTGLDHAHQRATDDLNAFESFLLGLEEKQKFTPESFEAAVLHFERAVALDPDFATAWASLSLLHTYRTWSRPAEEHAAMTALASDAVKRGLAADPTDPHVNWRMAGHVSKVLGDRAAARTYLRRAAELAPSDADVIMIVAWMSPNIGFYGPEPLAQAEYALRLNPRAPAWYRTGHGLAAFAAGEYRLSADLLETAPSSADTLFFKALAHVKLSEMAEAQRVRDALMTAYPDFIVQNYTGVVPLDDPTYAAVLLPAEALGIPLTPPEPVVSAPPSIVILPFEASEDDERWTRIGRGLSAEIAGELARNDWLDVIAPYSAQTLAGQDATAAADSFGVRFVMTGGVQVSGDSLRINASLHDAETDRVLWSQRWQRPQAEIFDVQDEILARIGASLTPIYSGVLARSTLDRAHQRATDDLSAFESFLLGLEQKHKFTPEGYRAALAHLNRAVALDPGFAAAWATLSVVYEFMGGSAPRVEHAELNVLSRETARKGIEADPNDPTANWQMAAVAARVEGDFAEGRRYLRKSVALAPNDADVLLAAGWVAAQVGVAGPEPLQWAERALVLNPQPPAWYQIGHGLAAFASGEYRRSAEIFEGAPPSLETLAFKALAYAHLSEMDRAEAARDALFAAFPDFVVSDLTGEVAPGDSSMNAVLIAARALGIPISIPEIAPATPPSIVILPFEASEDDPRWSRIGRGLSAEIAGELARNDWLTVIAPHSAERVGTRDAPQAADRLDVRYVLSGTIQVAGDSLRVNASLHDADTDRVLWSERWQRPQAEVFEVQDEILARTQSALSSVFTGVLRRSERLRAQSGPAESLSAFEYFLLGIEQKVLFTPDAYRQSIAYLEQAVALDPDYAEAWATLSLVYDWLARTTVPGDEERELRVKERRAGLRGFAADPSNPTVLWRMSQIATNFQDDRVLGRAHVRRAVEVAPGDADTLLAAAWLGPFLGIWGEDPRRWADRARALNPDAPVWYDIGHGLAAFSAGDHEAAVDTLRTAPRTDATLFFLALAHMNLGEEDEAQRIKTELLGQYPNFSVESLIGPIAPGDQSMDPVVIPAQALGFVMRPPGGLAYLAAR